MIIIMKKIQINQSIKNFTCSCAIAVLAMCGAGIVTSCAAKATPEDEVRDYVQYFADKVNQNQVDSIKGAYPEVLMTDSLISLPVESINIVETSTPGQYNVTFSNGITMVVTRSEDGRIIVNESKGLFYFPENKLTVARQTGMVEDDMTDGAIAQRLADKDFFKYLEDNSITSKNILTLDKKFRYFEGELGMMRAFKVANNTDQKINGSDYQIKFVFINAFTDKITNVLYEDGKDIPPHSTVEFIDEGGDSDGRYEPTEIVMLISEQEIQNRFATRTGNEYKEYLSQRGK